MQGIPLKRIVTAFAEVKEFHALGRESYPMCRALTSALLGKCLEPNTMVFEELLAHYSWSRANDYRATANHRPAARQQRQ